jgi:hypothetical protein
VGSSDHFAESSYHADCHDLRLTNRLLVTRDSEAGKAR